MCVLCVLSGGMPILMEIVVRAGDESGAVVLEKSFRSTWTGPSFHGRCWPGGPPAYPVADAESLLGAIVSNTVREHAPIAYTFCGICCVTSGLSTFYLSMCGCFCLRLHTRR